MAHSTRSPPPGLSVRLLMGIVLVLEGILLSTYFLATPAEVTQPRFVLYPFVWINVGLWAVFKIRVPTAPRRHRLLAAAVAGGYFLLLANWAGLLGLTTSGHHGVPAASLGLSIGAGSPGWERVRYITETFYVSFVPFRVIGYVCLAYLVYAAVLDVTSAAFSGALGLLSCLSCSFPILASAATGIWGGSLTLMSADTLLAQNYDHALDLSTLAFLLSVALLYWRPGFPSLGRGSDDDS